MKFGSCVPARDLPESLPLTQGVCPRRCEASRRPLWLLSLSLRFVPKCPSHARKHGLCFPPGATPSSPWEPAWWLGRPDSPGNAPVKTRRAQASGSPAGAAVLPGWHCPPRLATLAGCRPLTPAGCFPLFFPPTPGWGQNPEHPASALPPATPTPAATSQPRTRRS